MDRKQVSIIVIEDNDGDFVLIEDYLIEAFLTVQIRRCYQLSDYVELLENTPDYKFDLVLLDLHLPDASGLDLVERILSLRKDIPVIILTGYTDSAVAKESLKLGIHDFLIKDEITPNVLHKSAEFAWSRNLYVRKIAQQHDKLSNIAWVQSHIVRAPLARLLGIINLIETKRQTPNELAFLLKQLRICADELDVTIRDISNEAQTTNPDNNTPK